MKRHALIDHLHRHGCRFDREGSRHTLFINPVTGVKAPVPRHGEIDNRLALKICQQLSVPPIR